jgi:hypothetical protein
MNPLTDLMRPHARLPPPPWRDCCRRAPDYAHLSDLELHKLARAQAPAAAWISQKSSPRAPQRSGRRRQTCGYWDSRGYRSHRRGLV